MNKSLYSTFKSGKSDSLSDILKSTKTIIRTNKSFHGYLDNYTNLIQVKAFKVPSRSIYPILRSSNIIPIKKNLFNCSDSSNRNPKKKYPFGFKFTIKKPQGRNMKKVFVKSSSAVLLGSSTLPKRTNQRNALLDDFSEKWKKYPDLKYDESEIYGKNEKYKKFISDQINFIKKDKIENITTFFESTFQDMKEKKVSLRLTSMKIKFTPIRKEEVQKGSKFLVLPFAYLFLFYHKDFDYFKNILLATIKFDKNFSKVYFDDEEIYSLIRNQENDSIDRLEEIYSRQIHKNSTIKFGSSTHITIEEADDKTTRVLNCSKTTRKFIHNAYQFYWCTPNANYKVELTIPMISCFFECSGKTLTKYVEKDFFLFLLTKQFRNWDFYVMNYFFSLKKFRLIIEGMLSKSPKIYDGKEKEKETIELSPKKVYQFSLEDLSFSFFITEDNNINSIITIDSFSIRVDCSKVNPSVNWKFNLNLRQMLFLSRVSKFEPLGSFIKKIIIMNSQEGSLTLDFSVFSEFDVESLNYEKKFTQDTELYIKKAYSTRRSLAEFDEEGDDKIKIRIIPPGIDIVKFSNFKTIAHSRKRTIALPFLSKFENVDFSEWPLVMMENKDNWYSKNDTRKRGDSNKNTFLLPNEHLRSPVKNYRKQLSTIQGNNNIMIRSPSTKYVTSFNNSKGGCFRRSSPMNELNFS